LVASGTMQKSRGSADTAGPNKKDWLKIR